MVKKEFENWLEDRGFIKTLKENVYCKSAGDKNIMLFKIFDNYYIFEEREYNPLTGDDETIYLSEKTDFSSLVSPKSRDKCCDKQLLQKEDKYIDVENEYKRTLDDLKIEDLVIMRNISKEYNWIARDYYGGLYLYKNRPFKNGNIYVESGTAFSGTAFRIDGILHNAFNDITWSNSPYKIIRKEI